MEAKSEKEWSIFLVFHLYIYRGSSRGGAVSFLLIFLLFCFSFCASEIAVPLSLSGPAYRCMHRSTSYFLFRFPLFAY